MQASLKMKKRNSSTQARNKKFRFVRSAFAYSILAVNAFFSIIFIVVAYSSYINPVEHPIRSCITLTFPIFLFITLAFLIFWIFVRPRFALLSFVALLVSLPQIGAYIPFNTDSEAPMDRAIKIISYNTMSLGGDHKSKEGNPILKYILDSNADIVCLQEYNETMAKRKENQKQMALLKKKYPYSTIKTIGSKGSFNEIALFTQYPILKSKKINLESDYNGAVQYELKVGKDTLMLINVHLESNKLVKEDKVIYEELIKDPNRENIKTGLPHLVKKLGEAAAIRAKQANQIAEIIKQSHQRYIVVCGDFNDTPISYTHRVIGKDLNDAFTETGNGFGISYNQHRLYFRIDHIMTSDDIKSYDCKVDKETKGSDHYPISCFITLEK